MHNLSMKAPESWFVYILECENGSFYTGFTDDLSRRYEEHLKGTKKSRYTRSFKPVRIVRSWLLAGSRASAMKVERLVKGMDRKMKDALVKNPQSISEIIKQHTGLDIIVLKIGPGRSD